MKHLLVGVLMSVAAGGIVHAQVLQEEHVINLVKSPAINATGVMLPQGEIRLGSIQLTRGVLADGEPLDAGTYEVRVTSQTAEPDPAGQTAQHERWAEFLQDGQVKGRDVVTIIPDSEIGQLAKEAPPASGGNRVELLKGNRYVRIWINRDGNHYLFHLPPA